MTRPVDVLSEPPPFTPYAPEDEAYIRRQFEAIAKDPDGLGADERIICGLLATLDAARSATPARSDAGDGLDVDVLGAAIVAAVRAERAPIGGKGDGWPAYVEKGIPATVLNVTLLARRVATEYAVRLAKDPTDER